jgi:hypothetical protein
MKIILPRMAAGHSGKQKAGVSAKRIAGHSKRQTLID